MDRPSEMNVEANANPTASQANDAQPSDTSPDTNRNSQPSNTDMQVEASNVVATETPVFLPPAISGILSAASEAGPFVTPNFMTPVQVCPGAPARVAPETPDVTDANLAPTPNARDDDELMDTTGESASPTGNVHFDVGIDLNSNNRVIEIYLLNSCCTLPLRRLTAS